MGLIASILCVFLLYGYSYLNYKKNGIKSISVVSNINQLDILINANLFYNGNDEEITETIKANLIEPHDVWNDGIRYILFSKFDQTRITNFVNNCIKNELGKYINNAYNKIYDLRFISIWVGSTYLKSNSSAVFVKNTLNFFYISFQTIFIILILDLIFLLYVWIKNKKILWFKFVIWAFVFLHFFMTFIGAQAEFNRLFIIAVPCIFLIIFSYIDLVFSSIDISKLKKSITYLN